MIHEPEFKEAIKARLEGAEFGSVTGPGRSGAVAAVYASHLLGIPYIPFGQPAPVHLGSLLIIDTASLSGRTLRRAERKYQYANPKCIAVYNEPPRVKFWYEGRLNNG